ncbi:uncharacterized protein B4U79_04735, partial [Dinothrombium tinctorium]
EKVLEKVVYKQIIEYIDANNILSDAQCGFQEGNSCEMALQLLLFEWLKNIEENKYVVIIFLDFKRAFETICRKL